MKIPQLTSAALASVILATGLSAQNAEANSSSSSKSVIVISKNGKTYKKVIENGKVVEESGDKSLGKNIDVRIGGDGADIEKIIERVRRGSKSKSSDSSSSKSAKTKRKVVVNGKTIIDEESDDFGDLPRTVRDVLKGKGLIERAQGKGKGGKKGKSRIIINKDGKNVFDEIGGIEELDIDLPVEISELFDGRGFDIEKLIEKAHGGGQSRGRVIVKENGETVFDEIFDELGKGGLEIGGFDWDELDLPIDMSKLLDKKGGRIVIGMPEIEIAELGELPEEIEEMMEEIELGQPRKVVKRRKLDKAEALDTPKELERRVRVRRDAGEVKTLEAEVKRLQKQVEALQRELKKAKKGKAGGELF